MDTGKHTETVNPAAADFLIEFDEASRLAFNGILNSADDQEFFRYDSYENKVNYGDERSKSSPGNLSTRPAK